MRLNINLATQPYEDARRFFVAWTAGLVALALVTAALILFAVRSWQTGQEARQHIQAERTRLAQLDQEQERDLAILNRPDNREVRERSLFLNTLIRRKQFSWTRVFATLEQLMPSRLHVVSINPRLTEDDEIMVRLLVAGDSRDKAIELVRNLEQSKSFRSAQVHSESTAEGQLRSPGDAVQFEITAVYVPGERSKTETRSGE